MFVHSGLQTLLCFVFHSQSVVIVIIINGNKKRNHPLGVDVQSLHLTGTVTVPVIKNICLCSLRMYMLLMYSLNYNYSVVNSDFSPFWLSRKWIGILFLLLLTFIPHHLFCSTHSHPGMPPVPATCY